MVGKRLTRSLSLCLVGVLLAPERLLGRSGTDTTTNNSVPSGCTEVPVATSPEKFTLLTGLAETFNATGQEFGGECAAITVYRVSSGAAARMLSEGWPTDGSAGPAPVLWSPGRQHLGGGGQPAPVGPGEAGDRQRLPADHADSPGVGDAPADGRGHGMARSRDRLVRHSRPRLRPRGWGSLGHPEWGDFRLGKTNPNFSTSGLSATAAIYYAATGKTSGLTEPT